jgi:tetratricopeptide (TPR) repeat protein
LETARLNRIDSLAVRGLVTLGLAYARKGDSAGAERYDQEALTLARSGNSARLTAYSLLSLASLHDSSGRYADSEREAAEALAFYQGNGFSRQSSQCMTILGRARLRGANDLKGAVDYFQRASTAAERAGDRSSAALVEQSLGAMLSAQQRYPEAAPHYQKEMDLSTRDEQRGYAALRLGETQCSLRRYEDAKEAFRAADAISASFPALRLNLLRARAIMELSQGHHKEAEGLANQAFAAESSTDPRLHLDVAAVLGLAYAGSRDFPRALRLCRDAVQGASRLGQPNALLRARLALGQVLLEIGDHSQALRVLRDGEPDSAKSPEARWRLLALMSQADPQYKSRARDALNDLEQLWGAEAFRTYLTAPDIQQLSRPLFKSIHAPIQ